MYQTPTDDPYVIDPAGDEPAPKEPGRFRKTVTALISAVALFAAGVGIGWLVSDQPQPETRAAEEVVEEPSTTTTTVAVIEPAQESPPTTLEQRPPSLAPVPDLAETDEPIADTAESVLPSMVQIELSQTGVGSGIGSGFIYDANGRILTAAHVVDGFSSVTVRLSDGRRLEGTVLGTDDINDIAVVEVDGEGLDLVPAPLALDVELRVGQLAIAVGSPWGLDSTVTSGIVSAVDRPVRASDGGTVGMIQTDAAINPGNSGGALVDRAGRIIGVNVSIFTESGANDGVGFAVPIERAFEVAETIAAGGTFVPGYVGIQGSDAEVGERPGAVVSVVLFGEAAADAGIQANDVITAINGRVVTGIDDLAAKVREYQAGTVVTLDVERNGETIQIDVTLGSR